MLCRRKVRPCQGYYKSKKKFLLDSSTPLFIGQVEQHYATVASTNTIALELIAKTAPSEGTVISADFQSAGKGQIGSSWVSDAGQNLLLSVILRPIWLPVVQQFSLSQAIALAVADTVQHFSAKQSKVAVKWPNDVYCNNQKIAGILIKNTLTGNKINYAVVGIGLNVNQSNFPSHLPKATSLFIQRGQKLDLATVKQTLFARLEHRYQQLQLGSQHISRAYLQQLYRYQEWAPYRRSADGSTFTGQIIGIQRSGHLAVQTDTGEVVNFDLKEIEFI